MNRKDKLDSLLSLAPPVGAEIEIPEDPPRFAALEQDDNGGTLWIYFGESLDDLRNAVATSETCFVEHVRVHDLDNDTVLVPVWRVEQFVTLEDEFSYSEGYVTIP